MDEACSSSRGSSEEPLGKTYRVIPARGPLHAVVQIPGSKSLTNRALVAAALADGRSTLTNALFADDTRYMLAALAAPYAQNDVFIRIDGEVVSQPYLAMTQAVMDAFGVSIVAEDGRRFIVPAPQRYRATTYAIEPDASNASYFLAAAAIAGGNVT